MSTADTAAPPPDRAAAETVLYQVRDGVAEITLNRPKASNAFDLETARGVSAALQCAATDEAAEVVLLRGEGRLFCGGGDLEAMSAAPDREAFVAELASAAHDGVRVISTLAKPVVAAVQGAAAGIGLSLVLGADLVVAGRSARFVTAYTSVGLTPDGGMSWLLPRAIGQRRASELILTSEPVDSERALVLGIASEICDDDQVLAAARAAAQRLRGRPSHAVGAARALVRNSWDRPLGDHLDHEAATIARMSATEETAALIDGFLGRG